MRAPIILALALLPSWWPALAAETLRFRDRAGQLELAAELAFPDGRDGRLPAMVVVHGSSGPSRREAEWAEFLRGHGFATLSLDYFGPRGITARSPEQPTPVGDVIQAVAALAAHPRLDPTRIGVIGFSRGAVMAIAAANEPGLGTRVHVALYPGCRRLTIEPDPALPPVLVLVGSEDSYTTADECRWMTGTATGRGRVADLVVYPGATHAWDGGRDMTFYHEAARKSVVIRASPEITERSRADVLAFLGRFGMD